VLDHIRLEKEVSGNRIQRIKVLIITDPYFRSLWIQKRYSNPVHLLYGEELFHPQGRLFPRISAA
jgi:hypothetical protein